MQRGHGAAVGRQSGPAQTGVVSGRLVMDAAGVKNIYYSFFMYYLASGLVWEDSRGILSRYVTVDKCQGS